eukprot:SAG11_NODE_1386_length_5067_cov_1.750403_5_plen_110_part_00
MKRVAQLRTWLKLGDQQGGVQLSTREFGVASVALVLGSLMVGTVLMETVAPQRSFTNLNQPSVEFTRHQRAMIEKMRIEAERRSPSENLSHAFHALNKFHGIRSNGESN